MSQVEKNKIDWLPHRDVDVGRSPDFSAYRPEVAEAMQAQRMTRLVHLADRVSFLRQQYELPVLDHAGLCINLSCIVHPPRIGGSQPDRILLSRTNEYSDMARHVAIALESMPASLFPAEEALRLKTEEANSFTAEAKEAWAEARAGFRDGHEKRDDHINDLARFNMTEQEIGIFGHRKLGKTGVEIADEMALDSKYVNNFLSKQVPKFLREAVYMRKFIEERGASFEGHPKFSKLTDDKKIILELSKQDFSLDDIGSALNLDGNDVRKRRNAALKVMDYGAFLTEHKAPKTDVDLKGVFNFMRTGEECGKDFDPFDECAP